MLFALLYAVLRRVIGSGHPSADRELEIEVVVLRHQVKVLSRKVGRPKLRRIDKAYLAACSRVLPRHRWGSFIVAPSTLLRWHRELVRRKWTYKRKRLGRPPIDPALSALICRMARDNPRWGYMRIKGECRKLGVSVAATTVKKVLRAAGLEPAPRRDGPSWSEFLRSQAQGIWACDFFTIETALLRTLYVLFFIEVGSRKLHTTSSTHNPSGEFVAQQARNLAMDGELEGVAFLIRDRDSKYTRAFDEVFISEGARVIKAPVRAPKANAFAERFVRTVRHEVLDLTLVLGRGHLDRILRRYEEHYNFDATRSTTTRGAPTEVWIFELQPEPPSGRSQPRCHAFAGSISSAASSMNTKQGLRDESERKRTLHARTRSGR
jgi:transposase InsO family protein